MRKQPRNSAKRLSGRVEERVLMKRYTSFRIGGLCELMVCSGRRGRAFQSHRILREAGPALENHRQGFQPAGAGRGPGDGADQSPGRAQENRTDRRKYYPRRGRGQVEPAGEVLPGSRPFGDGMGHGHPRDRGRSNPDECGRGAKRYARGVEIG